MKSFIFFSTLFLAVIIVARCGSKDKPSAPSLDLSQVVVKSRVTIVLNAGNSTGRPNFAVQPNQSLPVTVTNAANTNLTIDSSKFVPPAITNALLDFGTVTINSLVDNNLMVCGTGGTSQCGTALFRVYTTGVAGAGLYDAAESYGAPLTATLTTTPMTIGLGVGSAAVMQTYTIPAGKHVVHLSDFSPTPTYDIKADFTNAGAGSYTTTLVFEYGLTP